MPRTKTGKFGEILAKIPLKTRLKVLNEIGFINLIHDLGYRESKMWGEEEDPILEKLLLNAESHTEQIIEAIREWIVDGSPE